MLSGTNGATVLLFCALIPGSLASSKTASRADAGRENRVAPSLQEAPLRPVLLNAGEGLSVIGAALESRGRPRSGPDCSHLVHSVYERAGFHYPYVASSDLYAGIEPFHRVRRVQPGDVVVWPGHAGIVVNPEQTTFFGAFSSGIGVESYASPYWKERGAPRFYRYAKARSAKAGSAKAGSGKAGSAKASSAKARSAKAAGTGGKPAVSLVKPASLRLLPTNLSPPVTSPINLAHPGAATSAQQE